MSEELLIAQQEVYRLKDRLGMLSALHKGCSGIQAENARLREQAEALKAAILDIDAHSTAMGEDGDGFITDGYIVTVGSLHRALGAVGHTARKCSHEARCPTCAQAEALALGQIDDATARALVLHFGLKGAIDYATKVFQMGGPLAKEYGWLADYLTTYKAATEVGLWPKEFSE